MSTLPRPIAGIETIELYTPGDAGLSPDKPLRKLSSNENLRGPSPRAVEAITNAAGALWKYPNVDHKALRQAIADVHGIDAGRITCGVGSDELLSLLAFAYAGVGDEVIVTEHGFEIYTIATKAAGATPVEVKEVERTVAIAPIIEAVTANTKIVFIANPANPTGTFIESETVAELMTALPSNVLVVLDGAYAEFVEPQYDGGAALVERFPNLVMTRTFSKLYGLGGLRVGWCYASHGIIDTLNRIRGPFNLSTLALAGAEAAMRDQAYVKDCREKTIALRGRLEGGLRQLGLHVDNSQANFVLARFENAARAAAARDYLLENGYAVRAVGHYKLPEALRITIGLEEDVDAVMTLLAVFLGVKDE